jgi:hypothetical protein
LDADIRAGSPATFSGVEPLGTVERPPACESDLSWRLFFKGGVNLSPSLDSNSILRAGARNSNAGTPKASFGSSGRKVVSIENYLFLTQPVKKAKSLTKPAPPKKPAP